MKYSLWYEYFADAFFPPEHAIDRTPNVTFLDNRFHLSDIVVGAGEREIRMRRGREKKMMAWADIGWLFGQKPEDLACGF